MTAPHQAPAAPPQPAPAAPARAAVPVAARLRAVRTPLLLAGCGVVGAAALVLVDPNSPGSWGVCPLYALTGRYCAGCGGLRATHDLLVGDLAGAWGMNPLWVLLVPVLVALWLRWVVGAWRTGRAPRAPGAGWAAATGVVVVVYSVLRNVPALAPWLAP
jgi:hypothetical protein